MNVYHVEQVRGRTPARLRVMILFDAGLPAECICIADQAKRQSSQYYLHLADACTCNSSSTAEKYGDVRSPWITVMAAPILLCID
jgi:hypothetical protein